MVACSLGMAYCINFSATIKRSLGSSVRKSLLILPLPLYSSSKPLMVARMSAVTLLGVPLARPPYRLPFFASGIVIVLLCVRSGVGDGKPSSPLITSYLMARTSLMASSITCCISASKAFTSSGVVASLRSLRRLFTSLTASSITS